MEINEIVEKLKYYTPELPKEELREAIKQKDEITTKLLEMLEYTKENLDKIFYEEDEFFGYTYAFFLLAEFKEEKAFPYLVELLNQDAEIVEYIFGEDYPEHLPRLLASTYNGDDKVLFSIIENNEIDEFIRSSTLQTYAILYLYGKKDRNFIIQYFTKLLNEKKENDNSYLYAEIFHETQHLRLIELEGIIDKTFNNLYIAKEEIEDLKNIFKDENYIINRNIYPFKNHYEYIEDTVGIMEEWQCFRYIEDEEFENSDDYKICEYIINKRNNNNINTAKIGRNDICPCGSGKKYKKCCMNKSNEEQLKSLNLIDRFVAKAEWYLNREETRKGYHLLRLAWFTVQDICKENNIKSISEYDEKYDGYDSLLNWLQDYEEILDFSNEESKLYERIKLCNEAEELFELDLYWKEKFTRAKANSYFRLGNEELAQKIIEDYLVQKPDWGFGYVEMSDWYRNSKDSKHYNLEKAKEILLRAEKVEESRDIDVIYERLWDVYNKLGDKQMAEIYNKILTQNNK